MLCLWFMSGFITEQHLAQAEEAFPGIRRFFESLSCKPRTFLDLVALFEHWCPQGGQANDDLAIAA